MSGFGASSLISYLPAPVIVVDPEGHIIYANPAFESRFAPSRAPLQGEDLVNIFEGGGREAILGGVAKVCGAGEQVSFRLLEGGQGYLAIASPIDSEDFRVGVMILLIDEPKSDEKLLRFHAQIQEPLDEVRAVLDDLLEQTGGRRSEAHRSQLERGLTALNRLNKWSDHLRNVILGREPGPGDSKHDPLPVVRGVVTGMQPSFRAAGVELDVVMPAELPEVVGNETNLETALLQILRYRLADTRAGGKITLSARRLGAPGDGAGTALIVSVVDRPEAADLEHADFDPSEGQPEVVREAVVALGGQLHSTSEPRLGRVTSIYLKSVEA
jgi:hypothetical protein